MASAFYARTSSPRDKRLSGEFLLGYHCQRTALRYKANDGNDNPIAIDENMNETLNEGVPA